MNISKGAMHRLLVESICDAERFLTRTDPVSKEKLMDLLPGDLMKEAQYAGAAVTLTQQTELAVETRRLIEQQRHKEAEVKTKNYLS